MMYVLNEILSEVNQLNPIEWLRSIYETFGTPHPKLSMLVVVLLGAVTAGLVWQFAAKQAEKNRTISSPATTGPAVTTGPQSPAVTGQGNQVSYGQPPQPEKKKEPNK